jgi:hypothetical protein
LENRIKKTLFIEVCMFEARQFEPETAFYFIHKNQKKKVGLWI